MSQPESKHDPRVEPAGSQAGDPLLPAVSGSRPRSALSIALADSVRAALQLAQTEGSSVQVFLRGDAVAGRPVRIIEGMVSGFRTGADGRERVVIAISEGAENVAPIDGIVRVLVA